MTAKPLRVALLSAAEPGRPGSMPAYERMVVQALQESGADLELLRVDLLGGASGHDSRSSFGRASRVLRGRRIARRVEADVYHLLDGSHGFLLRGVPWARTLITVHDLIPALQARGAFPVPRPGWGARWLIGSAISALRRAGALCAVSRSTADDVRAFTGREVDAVIPNALGNLASDHDRSLATEDEVVPYLLHVGNNGFYKNRAGVVAVFDRIASDRPDLELVLAGAAPDGQLRRLVGALGLDSRVKFIVEPSDAELAKLYGRAALLLFPSHYEGFGWPPLEAMRAGCPVVCSDRGSLPEVVGDAALRRGPDDTAGLASAVQSVLSYESLRARMVARGHENVKRFTRERMGSALLDLYASLAGHVIAVGRPIDSRVVQI